MSQNSKIEWTDATWNPVSGCSHVSAGCKNCYAEKIAERFRGSKAFPQGFKVTLHPERLEDPLWWRKPKRIFVNSMSDLFHEAVPFKFILEVFGVMAKAKRHTFQVLTKRPERMLEFTRKVGLESIGLFPNIWLGVSVENQETADQRIPLLLQTPAAVRFISAEPLLGPVDLTSVDCTSESDPGFNALSCGPDDEGELQTVIDWVICGGESGPGARPMSPKWATSLQRQCQAAGTPFFFKQWGNWAHRLHHFRRPGKSLWVAPDGKTFPYDENVSSEIPGGSFGMINVGKKIAGRRLDSREWNEFPETKLEGVKP